MLQHTIEIPTPALTVVTAETSYGGDDDFRATWRIAVMAGDVEVFSRTYLEGEDPHYCYEEEEAVSTCIEEFGKRLKSLLGEDEDA